jgi:hypothetical protein
MKSKNAFEIDTVHFSLSIHRRFPRVFDKLNEWKLVGRAIPKLKAETKNHLELFQRLQNQLNEYEKHMSKLPTERQNFSGYPFYPPSEDIYAQDLLDADINPDDSLTPKAPNEKGQHSNEQAYPMGHTAEDLDIPGTELDDVQEAIGSEDEENNYYSIGGDAHDTLDESTNQTPTP